MSGFLNSITGIFGSIGKTFQNALDKIFPPEKRAEMLSKLQEFAVNNPKLAAFLTTQIALTGLPLLLFATFSLTVFLFSLIAALLVGLIAALLFTVAMVGVALIIVLPTIFLTTFAASFIFLWGLGGYYLLKWFNEGDAPAPDGTGIGDKLNSLTGGRMGWLVSGAKEKQEDVSQGVERTVKVNGSGKGGENGAEKEKGAEKGSANGNGQASGGADVKKHAETAKSTATEAKDTASKQTEGVQKRATKTTDSAGSAAKTTSNSAGTAKGAASGATGS
jgi:hypothetical protein